MTTDKIREVRERAAYCSLQASQTADPNLKKHWEDMAESWSALEQALLDKEGKS